MIEFKQAVKIFSNELDKELQILEKREPKQLYIPVNYTLKLGGKRVRPALLLMSFSIFSDAIENAVPAALAIEVFHNFTLLHDDIMDGADIRRNNPTVHRKYSNNTAILSGDAMSILAYDYLLKSNSNKYCEVVGLFTHTALQICEGQQFDMDFESRFDVTVDEYLEMIRLKTAVLLACSLRIGAILGGAPQTDADLLYDFGINLGMAFQLQDDLLDTYGDSAQFGKNIGGDIVLNKKTYLILKTFESASPSDREALSEWLTKTEFDKTEKIEAVKAIMNRYSIHEETKLKMNEYYKASMKNIELLSVADENKNELISIAQMLMNRIV